MVFGGQPGLTTLSLNETFLADGVLPAGGLADLRKPCEIGVFLARCVTMPGRTFPTEEGEQAVTIGRRGHDWQRSESGIGNAYTSESSKPENANATAKPITTTAERTTRANTTRRR